MREFLHPQVGRPLCRIFALAGDTWPELVIAADLLHEELGATGVHLVAEASDPIRMHRRAPPHLLVGWQKVADRYKMPIYVFQTGDTYHAVSNEAQGVGRLVDTLAPDAGFGASRLA